MARVTITFTDEAETISIHHFQGRRQRARN